MDRRDMAIASFTSQSCESELVKKLRSGDSTAMGEKMRATDIKHALAFVILVSLVALLAFVSGCTSAGAQIRESYTYSSEIYDAPKVSPAIEQEVLDFRAQDATDKHMWREWAYERGHSSVDLWWNFYISGCTSAGAQIREPYTYSSEIYDASKVSPATEQEVLDFLAQDATDENMWREGVYECGHFSADIWWNAYIQGLEACMVWVKRTISGEEEIHWVAKFRIEDETPSYWLWVEPSNDEVVDEDDYAIQDTFCGEEAFNLCKTWWEDSLN